MIHWRPDPAVKWHLDVIGIAHTQDKQTFLTSPAFTLNPDVESKPYV